MSLFIISLISLLLTTMSANAISEIDIKAAGTGQTTGHIATLYIKNNTRQSFSFQSQGFFIPSEGNFQSYVVPYPLEFTVAPSEKLEIPIHGYCADVNTPPAPLGHQLTNFTDWIYHSEDWFRGTELDLDAFYQQQGIDWEALTKINSNPIVFKNLYFFSLKKDEEVEDLEAGGFLVKNHLPNDNLGFFTNHALHIPSKDPFSFGHLVLDAAFSLSKTVNEMQAGQQLITPFTGSLKREMEALMQHSIWIYTATLEGRVYSKDDFYEKLRDELMAQTGLEYDDMPIEIKNSLLSGVEQFWAAFLKLGEKAMVFKPIRS